MSVDEPRTFSGTSKAGKPYSFTRRRFQVFANKVLYDCQDSRDDDEGRPGSAVGKFCVLEEGDKVSFPVERIDVGKALALSYDLKTD